MFADKFPFFEQKMEDIFGAALFTSFQLFHLPAVTTQLVM